MKKVCILLFIICVNNAVFAQTVFRISYNQKIELGKVDENTTFTISDANNAIQVKGNKINDFVFKIPGNYSIKVQEPTYHNKNECEHYLLPKIIVVEVSTYKMKFDASTMYFSKPIQKNKDTNTIVLSIEVTVETYNHKPIEMNTSPVNSAGIGTNIIAFLDKKSIAS
jgi:hypothetical protein